jgi:hypothetical protein
MPIILDIILDTDHDLNLYLGLISWTQIMIVKLGPGASFVDPFLSLIKSILVLIATPIFPTLDSHFSQVRIIVLLFLFSLCCISSLGKRAYCTLQDSLWDLFLLLAISGLRVDYVLANLYSKSMGTPPL